MPILDLCRLSREKIAVLDETCALSLKSRTAAPLPLDAPENMRLTAFLVQNANRIQEADSGMTATARILVRLPDAAREALDDNHQRYVWPALCKHPGRMALCGQLTNGPVPSLGQLHYGGLTADGALFVFVPDALYEQRRRELLLTSCQAALQPEHRDDLFWLAAAIQSAELRDRPESGSPIAEAARSDALDVAYWQQRVGPEPDLADSGDARHLRR